MFPIDLRFWGQIMLFFLSFCLFFNGFLYFFKWKNTMEARKKPLPSVSPPRLFLRVEDRGRKRCPCLNEAKIGSRVALQRNRQIIPTPRVDVCVRVCTCVCLGGAVRKAQPKLFHLGGHSGANNFKIPPKTHTHVHAHMQKSRVGQTRCSSHADQRKSCRTSAEEKRFHV